MKRLFLDANVLFSTAYKDKSLLSTFWNLDDVILLSSDYAVKEAVVNLETINQHKRLMTLLENVEIIATPDGLLLPSNLILPEKDIPILCAAIHGNASYLITGDFRHFGPYFGETIQGVKIITPRDFLSSEVE